MWRDKDIYDPVSAHCLAQYTSTKHTNTWPSLQYRKKLFKKGKKNHNKSGHIHNCLCLSMDWSLNIFHQKHA